MGWGRRRGVRVRVATRAGGRQPIQVTPPQRVVLRAELVEVVPRVDAAFVPVGEFRADGIVSDRLDFGDGDVALSKLQGFLSGTMAANLRRRRIDAQEFVRQAKVGS